MKTLTLILGVVFCFGMASGWGSNNNDRVLLSEVQSITLERGKMTTGRRSSPVPQLTCVGGTAGCHAFQPKVVQCLNRGSDGYDAQWECKTDMDAEYRFGRIQVTCEGYDYPEDKFILRGSCGLEYEVDLTSEGRKQSGGHGQHHSSYHPPYEQRSSGFFGKVFQMLIIGAIFYGLYKCCTGSRHHAYQSSYGTSGTGTGGPGTGGPGFWTGAATGGALGYLFGNRGGYNTGWGGGGYGYRGGYGGGSSWGSSRGGGWSSGGGSSGSSSRSTSGFGGTSRR